MQDVFESYAMLQAFVPGSSSFAYHEVKLSSERMKGMALLAGAHCKMHT